MTHRISVLWPLSFGLGVFGLRLLAFGLAAIAPVSCGKKGPPLAPLIIAPAAVGDVSASRFGDRVVIRFTPPNRNTDNSTPADVDRIEISALSVASAAAAPDAGVVVREGKRVGTVDTAQKPGAPAADEPLAGPRTFEETLTEDTLKVWRPRGPGRSRGSSGSTGSTRSTGAAGSEAEVKPVPMRVYAIVPVSGRGRRGPASLTTVPLVPPPPPVTPAVISYTETAISLSWVGIDGVAAYNVYDSGSTGSTVGGPPLNELPLKDPAFEDKRPEFGKTRCYSVTAVETVQQRRIESVPSEPACVTPKDTFPPAAPGSVAAVAGPGSISLIWDAVSAADLAGYLVLRGEAPGATLQALTPEPIKDTTYKDAAVTPGTRYVYAVVAVDASKNRSAQSALVEETAR